MDVTYMAPDLRYFEQHKLNGDWPFTARQAFHLIHAHSLGGVPTTKGSTRIRIAICSRVGAWKYGKMTCTSLPTT